MRNDSFYSTVAQVLPTLLIALAVDLISFRKMAQDAGLIDPDEVKRRWASDNPDDQPTNYYAIAMALVGMLTILAETCAVLVLLTGTDTWFPIIAGPVCAFAVLVVTLLVAWIIWVRQVQDRV
jgi:hypothetical protein